MKGKIKTVIGCTSCVVALSMFTSMAVLAEENSGSIDNTVWSYRAVANVTTQVNIRAYASTDSAIIGYLPKAGAADVIERGEEWSHIISNGVEGYIKNEYLAYGNEAKKLAEVYGMPGVETNWDEVRVFAAPNAASKIVATVNEGQNYQIISEEGDWISVQLNDSSLAYVPAEDVEKTILLEKAIPVVTDAQTVAAAYSGDAQGAGTDYTGTQSSTEQSEVQTQSVPQQEAAAPETEAQTEAYTETPETQAPSAGAAQTEAGQEQAPETEAPSAEAPVTDTPSTEAPAEEPSEETVTSASSDDVSLLAALIYCEAGNQSRDGKVAVGAVVLHRVASGSFANSISGVIYESGQFTPAYSGALASALANGVPDSCYEAAQAALNGEDPVPGALYFNTGSGKGVKIGAHQFY